MYMAYYGDTWAVIQMLFYDFDLRLRANFPHNPPQTGAYVRL